MAVRSLLVRVQLIRTTRNARNLADMGQPSSCSHPHLMSEGEITPGITKAEYAERRQKFTQELYQTHQGMMNKRHLVIIPAATQRYMTNDIPYRFHQQPDFLYLSGLQEPDCLLLLESGEGGLPNHKSILYVQPADMLYEQWNGPRCSAEAAVEQFGVDEAYDITRLREHLQIKYAGKGYSVWYDGGDSVNSSLHDDIYHGLMTAKSDVVSVHSPTSYVHKLRITKSIAEIALMKKAGKIGSGSFKQVMANTRPGMGEWQLESCFEHFCKMGGAQWMSFPPVVAGGDRALTIHYIRNDQILQDNQLVLMDAGCEYHGYTCDITRTWPVNGSYSLAQRTLYECVLDVQRFVVKECKTGNTLNRLHFIASNLLADKLKDIGIISNRLSGTKLNSAITQLFPHHVGHYLGMDVHDTTTIDRNISLQPNMAITCEPGLYIPRDFPINQPHLIKEFQGIGIRIEDDILITSKEAELLNPGCPKEVLEIETIVGTTTNDS